MVRKATTAERRTQDGGASVLWRLPAGPAAPAPPGPVDKRLLAAAALLQAAWILALLGLVVLAH